MSIGVPIKLLHEAENHVVTVELKTGELFRGYLMEAEVINNNLTGFSFMIQTENFFSIFCLSNKLIYFPVSNSF